MANVFSGTVVGVAMSNATPGAHSVEEAKEALNEKVGESVHEEHRVHEPAKQKRKPRVGNMGVRQSWSQCIGERSALMLSLYTLHMT